MELLVAKILALRRDRSCQRFAHILTNVQPVFLNLIGLLFLRARILHSVWRASVPTGFDLLVKSDRHIGFGHLRGHRLKSRLILVTLIIVNRIDVHRLINLFENRLFRLNNARVQNGKSLLHH